MCISVPVQIQLVDIYEQLKFCFCVVLVIQGCSHKSRLQFLHSFGGIFDELQSAGKHTCTEIKYRVPETIWDCALVIFHVGWQGLLVAVFSSFFNTFSVSRWISGSVTSLSVKPPGIVSLEDVSSNITKLKNINQQIKLFHNNAMFKMFKTVFTEYDTI